MCLVRGGCFAEGIATKQMVLGDSRLRLNSLAKR